jgi:hypothetical protein
VTSFRFPRLLWTLAVAAALSAVPAAASAATVLVINNRDDGPGSFRDAIRRANTNGNIDTVQFLFTVRTIRLLTTVEYIGTQALVIYGNGATLDGSAISAAGALDPLNRGIGAAFRASGGGDLAVSSLTVRNAPGEGIALIVPNPVAAGTVKLWLFNVEAVGNKGHGVLVNDQDDPRTFDDDEGDPIYPHPDFPDLPNGSAAGLEVTLLSARLVGNGFGALDRDGLRVNEGGPGDLKLTVRLSVAEGNGADGIELDERSAGDVHVDVFGSRLNGNGTFSSADYDDGFDIDELDAGSIVGQVVLTSATDNAEEGLDFNENHAGDLRVNLLLVEANGNREEAIDYEEDDDFAGGGDLVTTMTGIRASGNAQVDASGGDGAVKIREKGAGNLQAALNGIETLGNNYDGINLREDADGDLQSAAAYINSQNNVGEGLVFDERGGGALTAALARSFVLNNAVDLFADDNGTFTVQTTTVVYGTSGGDVLITLVP